MPSLNRKLLLGLLWGLPSLAGADPSQMRQRELLNLLLQDCGSCHGLKLNGGLGPALKKAALDGKQPARLVETILYGRPGTAMPPWKDFLTQEEANWLVYKILLK